MIYVYSISQCFAPTPQTTAARSSLMIEGYQEGLDVIPEAAGSDPAEAFGNGRTFKMYA